LLRGVIECPARLAGIETGGAGGGGCGAEISGDAVGGQAAFIAERGAPHGHDHAWAYVIAERHRAQKPCTVDAELLARRERRGTTAQPGCERDGLSNRSVSSACAMTPLASAASLGEAVSAVPAIVAAPFPPWARM